MGYYKVERRYGFYVRLLRKIFHKCDVKYVRDADSFRGKRKKKVFKHLPKNKGKNHAD